MSPNNEGLLSKIIGAITANLADDFIDWVQRKIAAYPPVQQIRESFQRDLIHSDAKKLFEGAIRLVLADTGLDEQKFKNFIEDAKNREIIYELIVLHDISSDMKLERFNIEPYFLTKVERQELTLALKSIRLYIIEKKKETFSPEATNILSYLKNIESKLENVSSTIDLKMEERLRPIEVGVSQIGSILQQNNEIKDLLRDLAEGKPKSYVSELSQIKRLIDEDRQIEAKAQLQIIQNLCSHSTEKDTLFLVNAYFAQIYLNSIDNQKAAIPYLEKAVEYCEDSDKKFRNKSILLTLNGDLEAATEAINCALKIAPLEPKNLAVKANILVNSGKFEDLLNLVNANPDFDLNLFLGLAYLRRDDFEKSIQTAETVLQKDSANIQALILLVDSIVFHSRKAIKNTLNPNVLDTILIRRGVEASTKLLDKIPQNSSEYLDILIKRALLLSSQNQARKASEDLHFAYTLAPENPTVLKNYAINCIGLEEYARAVDLSGSLLTMFPTHEDARLLHAESLIQNGNISKAIKILESSRFQDLDLEVKRKLLLIDAYNINFESSKSSIVIEELSGIESEVFCIEILKAKQARYLGQAKLAISILEKCDDVRFEYHRNLMLANLFYESDEKVDKEKSLSLFETVSNIQFLDNALFRRVFLEYQLGNLSNALDLCVEIQKIHGFQREYSELEGVIYFNSENFFLAGEIFKSLSQKFPGEIRYVLSYAFCLFRLGKESEATDALKIAERKKDHSAKNLAALSSAFASIGHFEKSIELAYLALKKDFDNPELHTYFFAAFLRVQNKLEGISAHLIETFRDVVDNFSNRFPGNDSIQRIEFPSDNPEILLDILKQRLEVNKKNITIVEQMYVKNKLPISFLATTLNHSLLTAWSVARHDPNLKIWSNHGTPNEIPAQLKSLTDIREIAIDPATFLTVHSMNLLGHILESVEIIWLSQSLLDSIHAEIITADFSLEKGHMTVYSENGVFYREEIPPDAIQKKIEYLNEIKSAIILEPKIRVFGSDLSNRKNEIDEKLEECFGKETARTLIFSASKRLKLYCDEVRLRELFGSEFGLPSFSTRAFLEHLRNSGKVAEYEFQDFLVNLYFHNHNFVSISIQTIIRAVEKANFFPSRECLRFMDYLKQGQGEPALLNITMEFLAWLWLNGPTYEIRTTWTDIFLNAAAWKRDKKRIVDFLLKKTDYIIPDLMQENRPKLRTVLKTWLLSKPLV